ncbi:MAG: hypothetical protein AB7I50_11970 [Vicinamibacterales bacterium]
MPSHLRLSGLLHQLAALVSALAAVAVFLLGLGALSIDWWHGPRVAATVTGTMFIVVAVLLAVWAGINAYLGRQLQSGSRPSIRLLGLVVAVIHLFVLPFGTALGVYGLWVLLHPEARGRFEGS